MLEPKKILIVDDDLRVDKMLVYLFESHGFISKFADSGSHAMELLDHFKPDVILLDLKMPKMDGFEVCEKIKKDDRLKNIPIICFSALPASLHKEQSLSAGACDYIEKPFSNEILITKINNVIN